MSAPETNIDKQKKRHGGPLLGMAVGVGFALLLLLGWITWEAYYGNTPGEEEGAAPVTGNTAIEGEASPAPAATAPETTAPVTEAPETSAPATVVD